MSKKLKLNIKSMTIRIVIVAGAIYILFNSLLPNFTQNTRQNIEEKKIERRMDEFIKQENEKLNRRLDVDIAKNILNQKAEFANTMIRNIDTSAELILTTVTGSKEISHDRGKSDSWWDNTWHSNISIDLNYKATISIPISNITFDTDNNGMVYISYSNDDIKCNSVEIQQYIIDEHNAIFDKGYSDAEKTSLIETTTQQIKDEILQNQDILKTSRKTIADTFTLIAQQFNVSSVCINGTAHSIRPNIYKATSLSNGTPINYYKTDKVPNKQLEDNVAAIIIHSTSNRDVGVKSHYNWLNNDPNAISTSFYVDDSEVGRMVEEGMAGFGIKSFNSLNNFNTISIEICETSDENSQLKTIENTAILVSELLELYPDAELITHKDVSNKNCPRIFYDDTYKVMSFDEFKNIVYKIK